MAICSAAILSWWGQGSASDQRVATILAATPGSSNPNFRWSVYYENEFLGNPTASQIQSDLSLPAEQLRRQPGFPAREREIRRVCLRRRHR